MKLTKEQVKEYARDYADEFMQDWAGEPQDLYLLLEQIEEGKGQLYDEFVEYLETKK